MGGGRDSGGVQRFGSKRGEFTFLSPFTESLLRLGLGWEAADTAFWLRPDLGRLPVQERGSNRGWAPWTPRPLTQFSQAPAPAPALEALPLPLHPPGGKASIRGQAPPLTWLLLSVSLGSFSLGHLRFTLPPPEGRGNRTLTLQRGETETQKGRVPCPSLFRVRLTPNGVLLPQLLTALTTAPRTQLANGLRLLSRCGHMGHLNHLNHLHL